MGPVEILLLDHHLLIYPIAMAGVGGIGVGGVIYAVLLTLLCSYLCV